MGRPFTYPLQEMDVNLLILPTAVEPFLYRITDQTTYRLLRKYYIEGAYVRIHMVFTKNLIWVTWILAHSCVHDYGRLETDSDITEGGLRS